jgi:peptidoglycan/LPS O-acetylase OafA/YrhL
MRGVAAITVVIRHFGQIFHGWEPESYLAVDIFFVLSGFVLAYKYDPMFEAGLKPLTFMRSRAIRLFPFALAGALIGLLSQLLASPTRLDLTQSIASFLLTAVALPTPPLADSQILFPFNTAFWSLFFELWVANVVFAFCWRWIRGPWLAALILAGAVGLIICQRQYHVVDVGWQWSDILAGLPRVIFSFFAGVAVNRYFNKQSRRPQIPSWICLLLLVAILIFPVHGQLGNLMRLGFILFVFPALVYLGSTSLSSKKTLYTFMGDSSYGLYTIHFPLFVIGAWAMKSFGPRQLSLNSPAGLVIEGVAIALACGLAFLLDAKFDRPFRRALSTWTRPRKVAAPVLEPPPLR